MNKKTIWAVFSVANDYNQPDNNLEAWWSERPTLEDFIETFKYRIGIEPAKELYQGSLNILGDVNYRFMEIEEGLIK